MRRLLDNVHNRLLELERRTQALLGVAGVLLLGFAAWTLLSGGPADVAVTGVEGSPAPVAPAAVPEGELVGEPGATGAPEPVAQPEAVIAEAVTASHGGGGDVATGKQVQRAWETLLNEKVRVPRRARTVAEEKASAPADVKEAAARLIKWQTAYLTCYRKQIEEGDWRSCLDGAAAYQVTVGEMWDQGAGFQARTKSSRGTVLTLVRQSNEAECHTLEGSESCTAW